MHATTVANLFFNDTLIGVENAPEHIMEAARNSSFYRAVLKKKFDFVTAHDFLKYARRLATLCDQIYLGSTLELHKDKSIPLGNEIFAASLALYEGDPGEEIDVHQLTFESFRQNFVSATSVVLRIKPRVVRCDIEFSFAEIQWTCRRPRTIFLYAQQGGKVYLEDSPFSLEKLLSRKLLYVPDVAPDGTFVVKLGTESYIKEAEGRVF